MRHDPARAGLLSRRMPGHIVLAVRGELDIAATARLRDQIADIVDDATAPVIIDLSAVSHCDASGLAMLVGVQRRAGLRGLTVAISEPSREASELLRTSGLDHAFTVYPTLAAARRGPGRSGHPTVA
jgi:anti-sigma B factor antagonist